MGTAILCLAALGAAAAGISGEEASATYEEASMVSTEAESAPTQENTAWDWGEWLKGWADPAALATITAIIGALAAVLKMASSIKRLSQEKQLTAKDVQEAVLGSLPDDISKELDKYLPALKEHADRIDETLAQFAKILALSQEGTPEARVAILDIIQRMGSVSMEVIDKAKAAVDGQTKAEEEKAKAVEGVIAETGRSLDDGTSI